MGISQADYIAMETRLARNGNRQPPKEPNSKPIEEADLHTFIREYCINRGWLAFTGSMAHRTKRTIGEPDFTILADKGRVFFFECKGPKTKVSSEQMSTIAWGRKLGHEIRLIRTREEFLEAVQ